MTPEQSQPEFDGYVDRYDELLADPLRDRFADSSEYFHRCKLDVLYSYLEVKGKRTATLNWLDMGCGRGDLLKLGKSRFASAFGCDVSAESLKHCQGIPVRLQQSTETMPFDAGSFDVVTAACVYHHVTVSERNQLTQAVRRVLRPGGLFCIFEHNPRNPITRMIVRRCPVDVNAVLLSPQESIALLKEAGFKLMSLQYYLFAPEVLRNRLRRFEHLLRRVPFGGQYVVFGEIGY